MFDSFSILLSRKFAIISLLQLSIFHKGSYLEQESPLGKEIK